MTKPSTNKSAHDAETRKSQIVELIKDEPMGWTELKDATKLSNSTLFRILNKLEHEKVISQELKGKKLRWKLTKEGYRTAIDRDIYNQLRTSYKLNTEGVFDFADWKPREKPLHEEEATNEQPVNAAKDSEDKDYYDLLSKHVLHSLFKGAEGKEILRHYGEEEPLFISVVFPSAFASSEPSNPAQINKFCQEIVREILNKKEQIYRWSLPKSNSRLDASDSVTNRLLLVFQIELTASKDKLKGFLEKRKIIFPSKENKNGATRSSNKSVLVNETQKTVQSSESGPE